MGRICDYTRLLKWVKWVKYGGGAIDHPRRTIALSIPRQEPLDRFHVGQFDAGINESALNAADL